MHRTSHFWMVALLFAAVSIEASTETEKLINISMQYLETDLDQAEAYITQAIKLSPEDPAVQFLCGRIMGRQAGDAKLTAFSYAKKSLNCFKSAVKLSPQTIKYRVALKTYYLEAPFIAGGDESLAYEQVKQITNLNKLEGAKAEIQFLMKTKKAKQLKQRLIEFQNQFPNQIEFFYRYGLLLQAQNEFESAYAVFDQTLDIHAQNMNSGQSATHSDETDNLIYAVNALYQIGRNAVLSQLHIQEGVEALNKYTQLVINNETSPPLEWAYLRLAQLHHIQADNELVDQYINMAKKSDDDELHSVLRKIKKHR